MHTRHFLGSYALLVIVLAGLSKTCLAAEDSPATAALAVGDVLPELTALDDQGQPWKSADHVGKKILVLYFYPGDFTGGCIKQAQKFQELVEQLRAAGAEVVGISGDEAATHHLFKESYRLPQTLLADPGGELAAKLSVPVTTGGKVRPRGPDRKVLMDDRGNARIVSRQSTFARWTYVIGLDGKILARRENVDPVKDAQEVLQLIQGQH